MWYNLVLETFFYPQDLNSYTSSMLKMLVYDYLWNQANNLPVQKWCFIYMTMGEKFKSSKILNFLNSNLKTCSMPTKYSQL